MCRYLQGTRTQWYSKHCYNTIQCCLSEYELYIYTDNAMVSCVGDLLAPTFPHENEETF